MSPRYLLVLGDEASLSSDLVAMLGARTRLERRFSNSRIAALVNADCPCIPLAGEGCILGRLFHCHGPAEPLAWLGAAEAGSIRAGGEALAANFWGGYVAAIGTPQLARVLRDPSGNFPCYYLRAGGLALFASDAALLAATGVAPVAIDFDAIGRQLFRAFVPSPSTALSGVRELLAGFALSIASAADRQEPWWSPWDHVALQRESSEAAVEWLRRTTLHSVCSWASTGRRLLLCVSGGLDSSIVAACLKRSGADTICLTMYSDDPGGDERSFARTLCNHLGFRLIERPYRLEDIDVTVPLAAHLPRPRDRTQAMAHEHVLHAVAGEVGADALVTGNGGDNVFGYSQSAAPVADLYLTQGPCAGIFTALLDVCRQTGCSLADAARQAWRLARGSPRHLVRPNPLFLHPDLLRTLGAAELCHPWLDAPGGALPGKAAHIATILRAQPNLEPLGGYDLSLLNPLMSQPLIEACLAVPSWEWREGGRDRSLARRAFADDLPSAILERRIKGTPSRFAAKLLDHFRRPIRERLLGGRLASHRVIDRIAVEHVLAGERPLSDLERVRILEIVNAEAWIDHWSARARQGAS